MQEAVQQLLQAQDAARSARKKGDALRRSGRAEAEVTAAYEVGAQALDEALQEVKVDRARIEAAGVNASAAVARSAVDQQLAVQLAETLGALGGLRQRTGHADVALAHYQAGAKIEQLFGMSNTYNRLNELRQSLLLQGDTTLQQWQPRIAALAMQIHAALLADEELSNKGWAWADLGDCLALLGRNQASADAYGTFVEKAEIKSPERTLDVLSQIAAKLRQRNDPGASRVEAAVAALQARLARR